MKKSFLLLMLFVFFLYSCNPAKKTKYHEKPFITSVNVITDRILVLNIQAGEMIPSRQIPYHQEEGDSLVVSYDQAYGFENSRLLYRNGEAIGWITGEKQNRLTLGQGFAGDTLDLRYADLISNYKIQTEDKQIFPVNVYRKSKPNNWLEPSRKFCVEHKIYLELPETLVEGKEYKIVTGKLNLEEEYVRLKFNTEETLNEAIHVSAIGYRDNDPGKRAYISTWAGNGGAIDYSGFKEFYILDTNSGEKEYQGNIMPAFTGEQIEQMRNPKSFGKTNVYHLDFGDFDKPGKYKIVVEGMGSSFPFEINNKVWGKAMKTAMRGFYHIRANIPLGPPYTEYIRPEGYYPGKHVTVYQSKARLMNTGDGLNALGTDYDNFGNLLAGKTNITDNLGWGGYHDAGDWDRRIQHLHASRWHLELFNLFPEFYKKLSWNIPESENELPDILDEAMFNIDFYRRLQTPEGGIRGGIEAAMHPVEGETSWQESLDLFVYSPDMWCGYIYAGVAARLAFILKDIDPNLSGVYSESALKAMEWSEKDFREWMENDTVVNWPAEVFTERCQAALELYRLTENKDYERIFLEYSFLGNYKREFPEFRFPRQMENTDYEWDLLKETDRERGLQRDAFFLYTQLPEKLQNREILNYARKLIFLDGENTLIFQKGNAYDLASPDANRKIMMSFFSVPQSMSLCRAYQISGDEKYLKGLVRSTFFGLGGGPDNQVYMSGISERSPKNLFHIDSRLSGQKLPEGLISYAQFDTEGVEDMELLMWPITWYLGKVNEPPVSEWPVYEMFHDIYRWVWMDEWTPMQSNGPNSYVWGYLAGLEL